MAGCILNSELKSVLFLLISYYKALGKGLNLSSWRVFIYKRNTGPDLLGSLRRLTKTARWKLADLVCINIYVQGLDTVS